MSSPCSNRMEEVLGLGPTGCITYQSKRGKKMKLNSKFEIWLLWGKSVILSLHNIFLWWIVIIYLRKRQSLCTWKVYKRDYLLWKCLKFKKFTRYKRFEKYTREITTLKKGVSSWYNCSMILSCFLSLSYMRKNRLDIHTYSER